MDQEICEIGTTIPVTVTVLYVQAVTREDAELRDLDLEEIIKLTTGGRDGDRRSSSYYKSEKERSNSTIDRGFMAKQARMAGPPSEESSMLGHVQARAWGGQVHSTLLLMLALCMQVFVDHSDEHRL